MAHDAFLDRDMILCGLVAGAAPQRTVLSLLYHLNNLDLHHLLLGVALIFSLPLFLFAIH